MPDGSLIGLINFVHAIIFTPLSYNVSAEFANYQPSISARRFTEPTAQIVSPSEKTIDGSG